MPGLFSCFSLSLDIFFASPLDFFSVLFVYFFVIIVVSEFFHFCFTFFVFQDRHPRRALTTSRVFSSRSSKGSVRRLGTTIRLGSSIFMGFRQRHVACLRLKSTSPTRDTRLTHGQLSKVTLSRFLPRGFGSMSCIKHGDVMLAQSKGTAVYAASLGIWKEGRLGEPFKSRRRSW